LPPLPGLAVHRERERERERERKEHCAVLNLWLAAQKIIILLRKGKEATGDRKVGGSSSSGLCVLVIIDERPAWLLYTA